MNVGTSIYEAEIDRIATELLAAYGFQDTTKKDELKPVTIGLPTARFLEDAPLVA